MKLPKLAIENHQFTLTFIALLVLFGTVSFFTMPRSEDPQVTPAGSSIIVLYPGANPADMEELILEPLEESINELEDIKYIKSYSGDGLAVIAVEFTAGSDPDDKYSDVVQKVNKVSGSLPEAVLNLEIEKWSITDVQVMQIALVSDVLPYAQMEAEADRLKNLLERVPGVKRVKTWAYPQQEVRIALDLEKIALWRIPVGRIIDALRSANQNIPGGYIDIGNKRFNIKTSGSFKNLQEIKNTIIHGSNGQVVYLKDVADVSFAYEDITYSARFNGKRAVWITFSQKKGTNIFDIRRAVSQKIDAFKKKLPPSMRLEIAFDQSESVQHRIDGFFSNLLQGLVLVGLIVFLAVGLRASSIVMLAIPFSILIGIGFVDLSDFGLEQLSIAGLVIALGLLVDNAIVVTENISRFIKMGYKQEEAAVKGTGQVAWAIVSSTATTVLAFVPMMMMRNITGDFIRSMPVTVVYTLTASLLISLMLTPYLSARFFTAETCCKESRFRKFLNRLVETRYRRTLDFALKKPVFVLIAAGFLFFVSIGMFKLVGVSFFPKAEKPQFFIDITMPQGTSLDETTRVTAYVQSLLEQRNEIRHYAVNIGHGNPRVYYNAISKRNSSRYAQIFVELKQDKRRSYASLLDTLRTTFSLYPGAKIEVKELRQGPPVEAPIAIRVLGENLDVLRRISLDVVKMISEETGAVNIYNPLGSPKTDLRIKINRDKAGMLGVPLVEIDRTVRIAVAGMSVSTFRDSEGKEYNLVVRLPLKHKTRLSDLDKVYVNSVLGEQIPLKQLAQIEFSASPLQINHYNLERSVTVTADIRGDYSVDTITKNVIKKLKRYDWPKGYRFSIGGELESREESFGGMLQAILVAIIGIFAVLVLQFRSYIQPLVVFTAIPLAIIGSVAALLISGYSFSFTAFIGLASLVGIVVNNSIILVDYTNQLRREGKSIMEALKIAGETRFIPIILTTATTVGGLLPLTLRGGTLWAPMGWTIIGGLLVSTFLTLIVVPVMYKLYTKEGRFV